MRGFGKPKRRIVIRRNKREMERAMVKKFENMKLIRAVPLRDFLDGCFDLVGVGEVVGRGDELGQMLPRRVLPPLPMLEEKDIVQA